MLVIIPTTRERRPRLQKAIDSLRESTITFNLLIRESNEGGWVKAVLNSIASLNEEEIVFIINDDMEVEPDCIEILLNNYKEDYLLQPEDGIQHGKMATTPFAKVKTIKKYLYPGYHHNFSDQEMYDRAMLDNKFIYIPEAKLKHHHFTIGEAEIDETYRSTQATMLEDRDLYMKRKGNY